MRKRVRLTILMLLSVLLLVTLFGCQTGADTATSDKASGDTSSGDTAADDGVRTVEEREDALDGERVISDTLTADAFPGLDEIGVAPKKQYFIAFSNGEDSSDWTRALRDEMENIAAEYTDAYGIRFEWTNAGNDSTKQLQDIESLIAKKPDLLFIMPNEAEPLAVVADWCDEAGIPLITINNEINRTPGEGMYICALKADFYLNGLWHGLGIVKSLEEKYGEPKGDVAEIQGLLGASPAILRGQAVRYVFNQYPDINIVISRPGEWDAQTSYAAAQDIFTVMEDGTLDAFIGSFDDAAVAAVDLAKALGRTDIENRFVGNDGSLACLERILAGEIYLSPETSPLYGVMAFEYAVQYLNGKDIPASITNPQRIFMAQTQEQKDALKEMIAYCKENDMTFVPTSLGYFDVFPAYTDEIKEMYPEPYWELDREDEVIFPEPWVETDSTFR